MKNRKGRGDRCVFSQKLQRAAYARPGTLGIISLAAAVALACTSARAVDQGTVTGAAGADGANGTATEVHNPNGTISWDVTPGEVGGAGGGASNSATSDDTSNQAAAVGGAGGNGGNGTVGFTTVSNGGDGGSGGNATASAQNSDYAPLYIAQDTASATGGDGGPGGNGGSVRYQASGAGGRGGDGGAATASATGTVQEDMGIDLTVSADAIGGSGGAGGSANGAGGNGGVASIGSVYASTPGYGTVSALAGVQGGNGGHGVGSGPGGNGANESIYNAVTAIVSTHFNDDGLSVGEGAKIWQSAAGGYSGGSNGGNPGAAGTANSTINYLYSDFIYNMTVNTLASGGRGGDCQNTNGGTGGNATALCQVGGERDVIADAYANYNTTYQSYDGFNGKGSDITSGANLTAGSGGDASATAVAIGTGTGDDHAEAFAYSAAGTGGNITNTATGNGGAGGNATASATATGAGTSTNDLYDPNGPVVQALAEAIGGPGGAGQGTGFSGGNGGSASLGDVKGVSSSTSSSLLSLTAHIVGGSGGSGTSGANGGNGADALLTNGITSATAALTLQLNQEADGGDGGSTDTGQVGHAGNGTSTFTFDNSSDPNAPAQLTINNYARGGNGGSNQTGAAGTGGTGTASTNVTSKNEITVDSEAGFFTFGAMGGLYPLASADGGDATGDTAAAGVGGAATATTIATSTSNFCMASAEAVGGKGGSASAGALGNGADGGSATASVNATGYITAQINITAIGGSGGDGEGAGSHGGDGAVPSFGYITGSTTDNQRITINDTLAGGNGGTGYDGANGGNGASVSLTNAFNLTNPGSPLIQQTVFGGNSGETSGTKPGTPGLAGNASSTLVFSGGQEGINGTSTAIAGGAGSSGSIHGGRSGDATAIINLSNQNNVFATAETNFYYAQYGMDLLTYGSNIIGAAGATAGDGGNATGNATATCTGTTAGRSAARATSQTYAAGGGNADITLTGNGGNGGNATAIATATTAGPDFAQASAYAFGGPGGAGSGSGFSAGNGGAATASANAITQSTGIAEALAQANAGTPGSAQNSAMTGHTGSSSATAKVNSPGRFRWFASTAQAPAGSQSQSQAQDVFGNDSTSPSNLTTYQSASAISAPAVKTDVTNSWATNPNVQNAFQSGAGNVNAILAGMMQTPASTSAPSTYSTSFEIDQANAQLNGNSLVVGMTPLLTIGSGLQPGDSLRVRIQRNGMTFFDQTFGTNSSIQANLQNSAFLLGPQNANLNGNDLDMQFFFDLTTSHPSSGLGIQFLLGNVSGENTGTWADAAGGSWAMPANWSGNALPIGPGTSAVFGAAITAPRTITLDQNTTVGSLDFDNNNAYTISPGSGNYSLTLDNAGADPTINVTTGHHEIAANLQLGPAADLSITANSALTFAGRLTGKVHTLQLAGSTNNWSAQLDLVNNDLIVTDGNISNLLNQIAQGYANGHWTGNGIIASAAAAKPGTALAIELNNNGHGTSLFTTFDNQPVTPTDILIKYTWLGDANLDGIVNSADLSLMNSNGNQWNQGDFNYDGKVDGDDYALFVLGEAESGGANISTVVPEPQIPTFLLIGLSCLCQRRCRRGFSVSA